MKPTDLVLTNYGLRYRGKTYPCSIGKGGLRNDKREGDGATPRGIHSIVGILYRPDRMAKPTSWAKPIGPNDLWSDDETDTNYNNQVRRPYAHSHEVLRRADPLYDLVVITDWNWPIATQGAGSAIFIHQYRRPGYPTEGCIALSRANLHKIAQFLNKGSRLIVK